MIFCAPKETIREKPESLSIFGKYSWIETAGISNKAYFLPKKNILTKTFWHKKWQFSAIFHCVLKFSGKYSRSPEIGVFTVCGNFRCFDIERNTEGTTLFNFPVCFGIAKSGTNGPTRWTLRRWANRQTRSARPRNVSVDRRSDPYCRLIKTGHNCPPMQKYNSCSAFSKCCPELWSLANLFPVHNFCA